MSILNEKMYIKAATKLRDAIHDIITNLDVDEYYDLGTISNILRSDYKLFITPNLIKKFLENWKKGNDDNTVFRHADGNWLKWVDSEEILQNNLKSERLPRLGKSRRKIEKAERGDVKKEGGWIKSKDGTWKFINKSNVKSNSNLPITKYQRDKYEKWENPITEDLIKKVFVLNHPKEATDIKNHISNAIQTGVISSKPENGEDYYEECWLYMIEIGRGRSLDKYRDYLKYAPTRIKTKVLAIRDKKKKVDDTKIFDREKGRDELSKILDLNERHYVVVMKFDNKRNRFLLKNLFAGYVDISKELYNDSYAIVLKLNKDDVDDLIYFNSFYNLNEAMTKGVESDTEKMVFHFIKHEDVEKVKYLIKSNPKYVGWDDTIDDETFDLIK